ncbi:MAG: lysostaphin resistance A-like protein [Planctomycetales bacterium]
MKNRRQFLAVAVLFEASLAGVAHLAGWWFEIEPWSRFRVNWFDFARGLAAAAPMLVLFYASYQQPMGPLRRIKKLLDETLGGSLAACRWYDLLLLALVAGIGEELLFRGVLHPRMGLAGSNVLFGLAHSVSPTYALLAGGMGAYLGWMFDRTHNLLTPITTHAAYDFVAFLVIAHHCRASQGAEPHPQLEGDGLSHELADSDRRR